MKTNVTPLPLLSASVWSSLSLDCLCRGNGELIVCLLQAISSSLERPVKLQNLPKLAGVQNSGQTRYSWEQLVSNTSYKAERTCRVQYSKPRGYSKIGQMKCLEWGSCCGDGDSFSWKGVGWASRWVTVSGVSSFATFTRSYFCCNNQPPNNLIPGRRGENHLFFQVQWSKVQWLIVNVFTARWEGPTEGIRHLL